MKFLVAVSIAVLLSYSSLARADLTIAVHNSYSKGTAIQKASVQSYVSGVGKGMQWANVALKRANQPLLFCGGDKLSNDEMVKLTSDAVKAHLAKNPGDTDLPVEMLMLIRLKELFPC
jgi:hypothetical protein